MDQEVKCILSKKGKTLLIIDYFKFCLVEKLKTGQCRWRCAKKVQVCSHFTSDSDCNVVLKSDLVHNHSQELNIQRQALNNSVSENGLRKCHTVL